MKGPQLGGLGGFSVKDFPARPAKAAWVLVGTSDKPGVGGQGEGYGIRGQGHRDAMVGAFGGTKASERAVGAALELDRQAPNLLWKMEPGFPIAM